ncbi:transmembrane protein 19-like [Daphnia carinata]|uniref:transmembrane protein 19-like n=1 Tax=Daphnia carinata TaxID=120202 RepID=UPI00257E1953|nr:transmembrane protein 19-like [Daphnia carinata]XP_057365932.1 transmembrane protein 19-like [Daphnia carinata]
MNNLEHTQYVPTKTLLKPIIGGLLIMPISLTLWVFGTIRSNYLSADDVSDTSPVRWFIATLVPAIISYRGLKKNSLSLTGALLGYFVGFILTITSYAYLASLMMFFLSSSWATKFRSEKKKSLEEDFRKGGQRNWVQVICNGGVAAYLGVIYFIESGSGEHAIDFHHHYRQSWLSIAILSTISCANGDTWASEFGTVMTDIPPRLITNWKNVPRGTNGGVTWVGILMSALGGLVVGVAYYVTLLLRLDADILEVNISQWPLMLTGLFGGLIGSLLDSFLGATCQFSGVDEQTGIIVEYPRPGVRKVSGSPWLDNHSVNLISSFLAALFVTWISIYFWPK